jgi:DNA-binding HxlR family transcriptional regulator
MSSSTDDARADALVRFFKVLAETNRLKIVGLLAHKPCSVEELSASLGVGSPTVSHHLRKLSEVGLVEARAEGPYSVYSLRPEVLHERARSLLGEEGLVHLAHGTDADAFDRKVLGTFLDAEGRIQAFPAQQKKYLVVLRHVVEVFEPGIRYPETEVNEKLLRFNPDTARLRRSLVDYGLMARVGGGGDYWRL